MFLPGVLHGADEPPPAALQQLLDDARERDLHKDPYWHRLLHAKRNKVLPGFTSIIDSTGFFVAADGRTNPKAELEATLAAFFSAELINGEPAHCRFRARYEWLKRKLYIDSTRLPHQTCEMYDNWSLASGEMTATLVFASADLSEPATMFGHTLLRLDRVEDGTRTALLSNAVNYAAAVDPGIDAFSYALRGLGGGYVGRYSVMPYHEKVRDYVRIEHRDLWEYRLDLSPTEVRRMLWHLWELRDEGAEYFFFSENCSYMLLALLETAREGLNLSRQFDGFIPYTIPVDTVIALRDAGLAGTAEFRPSVVRKIAWQLEAMDDDSRDWTVDYARGEAMLEWPESATIDLRNEARRLETTNEYIHYLFRAGTLPRDEAAPRTHAALKLRAENPADAEFPPVPVPPAPHVGHASGRLSLGLRVDESRGAAVLQLRPAYHDRLDPTAGFLPGAEIEFFETSLLIGEEAFLDRFTVVSVQSVAPWDRAFRGWLWQAQGGVRRFALDRYAAQPRSGVGAYIEGGAGLATGDSSSLLGYSFAIVSIDGNPDVRDGYSASAGLRLGAWLPWTNNFLQQVELDGFAPIGGAAEPQMEVRLGTHWQLSPRNGLRLWLNHAQFDEFEFQGAELHWLHYF